ncbi:MAG: M20/M25/M40 family metallo-hydrolase [Acidobacteriota bacterium]|nr:M20/M25/M40 family metallo-hydrolase [Acidobacteriota bacterium]MDW3229148.1 M20/M25/M40 family metallo-hydrolase [Acidobacteriota bacterium]MDY0231122.1 M20/M25/M40 family metallo-hydrolase [Candidatus Saccharicenans sp.]
MKKSVILVALIFMVVVVFASPELKAREVEARGIEFLKKAIEQVSDQNLSSSIKTLQSFKTRNLLSEQKAVNFGIGAARRWLVREFQKIPGLEVVDDGYFLTKQGRRIIKDTELHNIVAIKKGQSQEERLIIVNAHYDTIAVSRDGKFNYEDVNTEAPGANDDASGVAALLEMARIIAPLETEATIQFIAFAGEEQGLVGSTLYAQKMKQQRKNIEAVLTLDMIANIEDGLGYVDSTRVRVFSEDPNDSLSRELARYVRRTAQVVLPHFEIELIFRSDRFGRGGDHTPFVLEGYPGIRFTEARENYSIQHTPMDTIDNLSVSYCADITRLTLASVLSLACAPKAPEVISERGVPLLRRGQGYDAELSWVWNGNKKEISGFKIYVRDTKAPFWERSYFAGKGDSFTFKNVSIDNLTFGVSVIGANGLESLISIYRMPGRRQAEYVFQELK